MNPPYDLQIETTNFCQARCDFCPHQNMVRAKGFMEENLFRKLISDAQELGVRDVYLFLNGEPFLDRKIYDRVQYVKENLPSCLPILYSNFGVPIPERQVNKLKGSRIILSMADGVRDENVCQNIELLLKHGIEITIHTLAGDKHLNRAFQLSAKYGLLFRVYRKYNWIGAISSSFPIEDGYCFRPRQQMCVLWDGRVTLCCMTMEGEVILGDAKTQSLKEIWEGEMAERYRTTKKSGLDICRHCNMPVVREE